MNDGLKKGRSPTELLASRFWEISGRMTFPSDCLVVIDALDEAAPEALRAGANPLGLPEKLGRGIFVVITSRERDDCKLANSGETPVLHLELHRGNDSGNDAVDYIKHRLADPRVRGYLSRNNVSPDEFARTLMAKSEGNFMYLRHVLPELAAGSLGDFKWLASQEGLVHPAIPLNDSPVDRTGFMQKNDDRVANRNLLERNITDFRFMPAVGNRRHPLGECLQPGGRGDDFHQLQADAPPAWLKFRAQAPSSPPRCGFAPGASRRCF